MRARIAALVGLGLALVGGAPAHADFTVSGRFLYRDRAFDVGGFKGSTFDVDLPIRRADVEVYDAVSSAVLATGATDLTGRFNIFVPDTQTRDIRVRAKASGMGAGVIKSQVVYTFTSNVYAIATTTWAGHAPTQNIDFQNSPVVALQGSGGEPFNIYDQVVDAFDFLITLQGSRPTRPVSMHWSPGASEGTFYQHGVCEIHLFGLTTDSDGYDDPVILHELGHYVEFNLGKSDNGGGSHSPVGYYDLSLTWSEGYATFFQNMVRSWKGFAHPDIYVDTRGQPGSGQVILAYDLEGPSIAAGTPGANNEVTVNGILWDVFDCAATSDNTPGVDDDPMCLQDPGAAIWDVTVNYFRQTSPTVTSISLEDFWEGWFARGHGLQAEMVQTFMGPGTPGRFRVEYVPDAFESDNGSGSAQVVTSGAPATHHTTYGAGDPDWTLVAVAAGGAYTFETLNLLNGADTRLELRASNATTILASNDNYTSPSLASRISWTAPANGYVFVRCVRSPDPHAYGSYDLKVSGPPVPVEVTDVQLTAGPGLVELQWSARRDGAFSHFDVERGEAAAGPFARRNAEPLRPGDGATSLYAFTDGDVEPGRRYFYRLIGVEADGARQAFGPYEIVATPAARLALHAPAPNPFNPSARLRFELPRAGTARLRVFSAAGALVRTLLPGPSLAAGPHEVVWDGRDDGGRAVASGIYLVQLDAAGQRLVQRAVLVR